MESPAKRFKGSSREDILMHVKKDKELLNSLYEAALFLDHGYSNLYVTCQEIELADAPKSKCFSRAACYTNEYVDEPPLAIGALFRTGMKVLLQYTTGSGEDCLPEDSSSKEALKKLVCVLSEGLPDEFFHPEIYSESQWTVIVAQHLLSRLSLQSDYTIDDHYERKKDILKRGEDYVCACPEKDLLTGRFGDTSYGCPNGWHGFADILFETNLPARVTEEEIGDGLEDDDSVISDNSVSATSKNFSKKDVMQMTSQCIVFSFLQKKNDGALQNNLVPALGISKRKVKVILFDCVNDVLLSSEDLDFTEAPGKLDYGVIILLWLTLNYKIFCTGVPEDTKKFKAKFNECVGDKLKLYQEHVQYNLSLTRSDKEETRIVRRGKNRNPVFPFPLQSA